MEAGDISRQEILRYLGARRPGSWDEPLELLVEDCIGELFSKAEPRHIEREFPLTLKENGEIELHLCWQKGGLQAENAG